MPKRDRRMAAERMPDPWPSPTWKGLLRRRLTAWFDRTKRDLPWRRGREPYAIWVSEVMLQQTQVATVIPYYERFMAALPTLADLAAAPEADVLRLWEGLGYYRRARQLHRAANVCMADHGGRFPQDLAAARALPGIGRYTAGAILSIAFDEAVPILETNTLRVYSRLLAFRKDPYSTAGQRLLWRAAEALLPERGSGRLNQALIELGATVCVPSKPRCEVCPVTMLCLAKAHGLAGHVPRPKPQPAVSDVREAAIVIRRRDKVLVIRHGDDGRWAGLWDFPRFPVSAAPGQRLRQELIARTAELTGVTIEPLDKLATLRHGVTRFRITLVCHRARYVAGPNGMRPKTETRWVSPADLAEYPMSVTARKLAAFTLADD
jgi:A/G-specific adenine glycosylase